MEEETEEGKGEIVYAVYALLIRKLTTSKFQQQLKTKTCPNLTQEMDLYKRSQINLMLALILKKASNKSMLWLLS